MRAIACQVVFLCVVGRALGAMAAVPISGVPFGQSLENFTSGSTTLTYALNYPEPVAGLWLNGSATLGDANALTRVVLVGQDGTEFLIYETYSLLATSTVARLDQVGAESGILGAVKPVALKVRLVNAAMTITSLEHKAVGGVAMAESVVAALQAQERETREDDNVVRINQSLVLNNRLWRAGRTSVSHLSYREKRKVMGGDLPVELTGLEYYTGGIFEGPMTGKGGNSRAAAVKSGLVGICAVATTPAVNGLPAGFDWRNRHGANWLTSVKNQQISGTCWAFAVTAATEHQANLYFNRHLDLDLSEEYAACKYNNYGYTNGFNGGDDGWALDFYRTNGAIPEADCPYTAAPKSLTNLVISDRIKIGGYYLADLTEADYKRAIINGAVSFSFMWWNHSISFAGYGTLKAGDKIWNSTSNPNASVVIGSSDSRIGQAYWIVKNSWGTGWGMNGYCNMSGFILDAYWVEVLTGKVTSATGGYTVLCEDRDGDHYYNWGVGSQPTNCPSDCLGPDWDDSDPGIGPWETNTLCGVYIPLPAVTTIAASTTYTNVIRVQWSGMTSASLSGYAVWRSDSTNLGAAVCLASNIQATKYDDTTMPANQYNYYWVQALDPAGGGAYGAGVAGYAASGTIVAPTITSQPAGSNCIPGQTIVFRVDATGSEPMDYQWQKSGTNILAASNTMYALTNLVATNQGSYRCIVMNPAGVVTSAVAVLNVAYPVVIVTQPVAQAVNYGYPAVISVVATGTTPIIYQWMRDGVPLGGGTNAGYSIAAASAVDAGTYQCALTNAAGSALSANVILAVNLKPLIAAGGVSSLARTNATVNGVLVSSGAVTAAVGVCWGTVDGGTNTGSWQNHQLLGGRGPGSVSLTATGLVKDTVYYFRYYATNAYGYGWSGLGGPFRTLADAPTNGCRMGIQFSGYTRAEPLTNFPVLIRLGSHIVGFDYRTFLSSRGYDLRLKDQATGMKLNYEIESWDTNGNSLIWAQLPVLTSNSMVMALWGDPADSNQMACTTNGTTWGSEFAAVWHMGLSSSKKVGDSTANANHGTSNNTVLASGQVGDAMAMNGSNSYVTCGNGTSLSNLQNDLCLSLWVNPETNANMSLISKTYSWTWTLKSADMKQYLYLRSSTEKKSTSVVPTGQWSHVVMIFSAAAKEFNVYLNGALDGKVAESGAQKSSSSSLELGRLDNNTFWFKGIMDECRVESVVRSSNWVWACWMNQSAPTRFGNYGAVMTNSAGSGGGSAQVLWFPNPGNQCVGGVVSLAGTASSGLPVTFVVASGSVMVNGSQLTAGGVGRVEIVAIQDGDATWNPVSMTNAFLVLASPVMMVAPVTNALFKWPAIIPLEAIVTGAVGVVSNVQFCCETGLVGVAYADAYRVVWSNAEPGSYRMRAVAWDHTKAYGTSDWVNIYVVATNGTYAQWAQVNQGCLAGRTNWSDDPAGCGLNNLGRYAFGGSGGNGAEVGRLIQSRGVTNGSCSLWFQYNYAANDLSCYVEQASSLLGENWSGVLSNIHASGWVGSAAWTERGVSNTISQVEVTIPDGGWTSRFFRVRMTTP